MQPASTRTLERLAIDLAAGRITSRELVEDCLARITAPGGEGARTFLKVDADAARASADHTDGMRKRGTAVGRYAGIPISVKDLFDLAGEVTTAGSLVLRGAPPAARDAAAVARLREAGFIAIGRTNMTEFAFSGLGVNPHYGTPRNPWERAANRIPGGSSSGAAVSVTDGMAFAGLGTDTGGSCRIPAAMCGIVGFKPTACRVPTTGVYPLSPTLDSVGPLANSVACCAALDTVLAAESDPALARLSIDALSFAVPVSYLLDGLSQHVATSFERVLRRLSQAGAHIEHIPFAEIGELPDINRSGGFSAPEAYAHHRDRIAADSSQYDPRVLTRILRGREQSAADYIDLRRRRREFIDRVAPLMAEFDALLMPTVPIVAPRVTELAADEDYARINALVLRNSGIVNFIDGCAISLPCHEPGEPPVGLTLFARGNTDRRLLSVAAAVEGCPLNGRPS
ncbi:MAG TPA: amidase [Steroidobacteraceae bacterium]|nr:amidase [Steroidobacteraceae bacterium]